MSVSENQLVDESADPRFGIGGNSPPLDELIEAELAPMRERQIDMLATAKTAVIIDGASAEKVTDLGRMMADLEREIDLARDAMMRPYLEATRSINSAFNAVLGPLKVARQGADGRGGLRGMLSQFIAKREAEAEAERHRLLAEQKLRDAEAEAARVALEEKQKQGSASVADELAELQAREAAEKLQHRADAIRPAPIRSSLGTVGTRREITFRIVDLRKALGTLLRIKLGPKVEDAVKPIVGAYLRQLGPDQVERGVDFPGVEAGIEKVAASRR